MHPTAELKVNVSSMVSVLSQNNLQSRWLKQISFSLLNTPLKEVSRNDARESKYQKYIKSTRKALN